MDTIKLGEMRAYNGQMTAELRVVIVDKREEVRRLLDTLCDAKEALLEVLPTECRQLATAWKQRWENASDEAFWLHRVLEIAPRVSGGSRVYCPLCRWGTTSSMESGFSPEGLRRHLVGAYNSHQCSVIKFITEYELAYRRNRANG